MPSLTAPVTDYLWAPWDAYSLLGYTLILHRCENCYGHCEQRAMLVL